MTDTPEYLTAEECERLAGKLLRVEKEWRDYAIGTNNSLADYDGAYRDLTVAMFHSAHRLLAAATEYARMREAREEADEIVARGSE